MNDYTTDAYNGGGVMDSVKLWPMYGKVALGFIILVCVLLITSLVLGYIGKDDYSLNGTKISTAGAGIAGLTSGLAIASVAILVMGSQRT